MLTTAQLYELDVIRNVIKNFKDGASIENIMEQSQLKIEIRTFQRRLARLHDEGSIKISGNKRSTRYHFIDTNNLKSDSPKINDLSFISEPGKRILYHTTKSLEERERVGYSSEFLGKYRPNHSTYLSPQEIKKLEVINESIGSDLPPASFVKEISGRFLLDLTWNSARLEGNNYSLLEADHLILTGEAAVDRTMKETQMIINHKEAIEFITGSKYKINLSEDVLLNLYAILSDNLVRNPTACGRLRTNQITVRESSYIPMDRPMSIKLNLELIIRKALRISDPFEKSFFLMIHLAYLQPFFNLNECVSRIAVNIPLNYYNCAPLSFIDVPVDLYTAGLRGVYEMNRIKLLKEMFLWAYERSAERYISSRELLPDPDHFRFKYRAHIRAVVASIVSKNLGPAEAPGTIKDAAKEFPLQERPVFIELANTELLSLYKGNFARYRVPLDQFEQWKKTWNRKRRPSVKKEENA